MRLPIVNDYTIAAELISSIAKICPTDKVNATLGGSTLGGSSMYHHKCCDEESKNLNDERQLSEQRSLGGKIDAYV